MTGWRVVVGFPDLEDPDEISVDRAFPTWAEARDHLLERVSLERWPPEECPSCAVDAAEHRVALQALPEGSPWVGELEGDTYALLRSPLGALLRWDDERGTYVLAEAPR